MARASHRRCGGSSESSAAREGDRAPRESSAAVRRSVSQTVIATSCRRRSAAKQRPVSFFFIKNKLPKFIFFNAPAKQLIRVQKSSALKLLRHTLSFFHIRNSGCRCRRFSTGFFFCWRLNKKKKITETFPRRTRIRNHRRRLAVGKNPSRKPTGSQQMLSRRPS